MQLPCAAVIEQSFVCSRLKFQFCRIVHRFFEASSGGGADRPARLGPRRRSWQLALLTRQPASLCTLAMSSRFIAIPLHNRYRHGIFLNHQEDHAFVPPVVQCVLDHFRVPDFCSSKVKRISFAKSCGRHQVSKSPFPNYATRLYYRALRHFHHPTAAPRTVRAKLDLDKAAFYIADDSRRRAHHTYSRPA